jgi:hypothetical protein
MIRLFGPFERPNGQPFILVEDAPMLRNETATTTNGESGIPAEDDTELVEDLV